MCASKIVNTVPTVDAKFYAATQVIDEARHVEVFGRYRAAFEDMGVLGFADADLDELVSEDEAMAEQLDQERLAAIKTTADRA